MGRYDTVINRPKESKEKGNSEVQPYGKDGFSNEACSIWMAYGTW